MFNQWILKATCNVTFSQELPGGVMRSSLPDGPTTDPYGLDRVPASPLASPDCKKAATMTGIYGRTFFGSSANVDPRLSWVNKLQERLDMLGSTKCDLIWKVKTTPAMASIFRLAPSMRRTFASDSIGLLPTPSGTSNHGKNHVAGRLDEWGGSSNPFRGTPLGRVHCPRFELWMMGFPEEWAQQMPLETPSSRKSRQKS